MGRLWIRTDTPIYNLWPEMKQLLCLINNKNSVEITEREREREVPRKGRVHIYIDSDCNSFMNFVAYKNLSIC